MMMRSTLSVLLFAPCSSRHLSLSPDVVLKSLKGESREGKREKKEETEHQKWLKLWFVYRPEFQGQLCDKVYGRTTDSSDCPIPNCVWKDENNKCEKRFPTTFNADENCSKLKYGDTEFKEFRESVSNIINTVKPKDTEKEINLIIAEEERDTKYYARTKCQNNGCQSNVNDKWFNNLLLDKKLTVKELEGQDLCRSRSANKNDLQCELLSEEKCTQRIELQKDDKLVFKAFCKKSENSGCETDFENEKTKSDFGMYDREGKEEYHYDGDGLDSPESLQKTLDGIKYYLKKPPA